MNTRDFWTADTHFDHKAILRYSNRRFDSVEEMNAILIERWNAKVPPKGVVWFLGDLAFAKPARMLEILDQLHGQIHLIRGNHDRHMKPEVLARFASVHTLTEQRLDGKKVSLCHYPMHAWESSHYGALHFHGHSHGECEPRLNRLDVGVDLHPEYEPFNYEEIQARLTVQGDVPAPTHHGRFVREPL